MSTATVSEILARINAPLSEEEEKIDRNANVDDLPKEVPIGITATDLVLIYGVASGFGRREDELLSFLKSLSIWGFKIVGKRVRGGSFEDWLSVLCDHRLLSCINGDYIINGCGLTALESNTTLLRRLLAKYQRDFQLMLRCDSIRARIATKLATVDECTLTEVAKLLKLE